MDATRATVCRSCGAPRDPDIDRALCRPCFLLYKSAKAVPYYEVRARLLIAAYARLGLSAGNVWKLVPR